MIYETMDFRLQFFVDGINDGIIFFAFSLVRIFSLKVYFFISFQITLNQIYAPE